MEIETVDDFTAQALLDPKIYKDFLAMHKDDLKDEDAPICKFKTQVTKDIQDGLKQLGTVDEDKLNVVDVVFGFYNYKMLSKLEDRANALKDADFKKLDQV